MPIKTLEIDSAEVAIGMYISMLDRPWLETPFLFQGFEVKDRFEIETLQSYCSTVFIDVVRSDLSPAEVRNLGTTSRSNRANPTRTTTVTQREPNRFLLRLQDFLRRLGVARGRAQQYSSETVGYSIQSTVRAEAGEAKTAYALLSTGHQEMIESITSQGSINIKSLEKAAQPAIDSILRNPDAMAWTVFSKKLSGKHYNRAVGTAVWCVMFGRHLGLELQALQELAVGGLLLDIGNVQLPDSVAQFKGEISAEHHKFLSQHVDLGLGILAESRDVTQIMVEMVSCHHERADGSGYPRQLTGNRIPAFGRIAAIADCYDAMTTENAYSPPIAAYDSARALNDMRGKDFAAEVVGQFLGAIGMFPTASVVELNDRRIGVVLEQNRQNSLRPKVLVVLNSRHKKLRKPTILEMRDLPLDATHRHAAWIIAGHEHGAFGIDPMSFFN